MGQAGYDWIMHMKEYITLVLKCICQQLLADFLKSCLPLTIINKLGNMNADKSLEFLMCPQMKLSTSKRIKRSR